MRKAKDRWPRIGKVGLLLVCFSATATFDIIFELAWLRGGMYTYGGAIKGLTLFPGHYYAFPMYEAILIGAFFTPLAALRYFKDDKGRTFVERGIDEVAGAGRKTGLRFLAISGFFNVCLLLIFNVPMIAIHTLADSDWPKDVVNRSYFTNSICGPLTPYHCPSNAIPDPHPGSGYVAPDGTYVPRK